MRGHGRRRGRARAPGGGHGRDAGAPDAPGKPTVGPQDQAVLVTVAPAAGVGISGYHYECSSDNGQTWVGGVDTTAGATSAEVAPLTNGAAYVCRAFAQAAAGRSEASPLSDAVTPCGSLIECTPVLGPILGIVGLLLVLGIIALIVLFLQARRRGYVLAVVDVVHTANLGSGSRLGIRYVKDPETRRLTGLVVDRGPDADVRSGIWVVAGSSSPTGSGGTTRRPVRPSSPPIRWACGTSSSCTPSTPRPPRRWQGRYPARARCAERAPPPICHSRASGGGMTAQRPGGFDRPRTTRRNMLSNSIKGGRAASWGCVAAPHSRRPATLDPCPMSSSTPHTSSPGTTRPIGRSWKTSRSRSTRARRSG